MTKGAATKFYGTRDTLACEVDEEIEFTVGCFREASQALAGALPGAVRRVRYGEPAPMYRDPA